LAASKIGAGVHFQHVAGHVRKSRFVDTAPLIDAVAGMKAHSLRFQIRNTVIQTENNYQKEVFNGDIGRIESIDLIEHEVTIRFVTYNFSELEEVGLACAVTIHKSQGSEFPAVVIPLATQHYVLQQRNLIYTGLTGGRSW
jgi:exodeoxyribonuclease V alpha subunit